MLGESEAVQANRAQLGRQLLIARTRRQREISDAPGFDLDELPAAPQIAFPDDGARAGELLARGQDDGGRVDARLVKEGLMPGDERSRLPSAIVVEGQHGEPLRKKVTPSHWPQRPWR